MILTDYVARVYDELEKVGRLFCFDLSTTDELYIMNTPIDVAVLSLLDIFGNRESQEAFDTAFDEGIFDSDFSINNSSKYKVIY